MEQVIKSKQIEQIQEAFIFKDIIKDELKLRIDIYVTKKTNISRHKIYKWIKIGILTVNNVKTKPSYIIKQGDIININIPRKKNIYILPDVNISYQDKNILIINKDCNLSVQPGPGWDYINLQRIIEEYIPFNKTLPRSGIVHRLDRDTSGLIVIAKNIFAFYELKKMFKQRTIKRIYLAVVQKSLSPKFHKIEKSISRCPSYRLKMCIDINGKPAITFLNVIKHTKKYSIIHCCIRSGRMHQIRVHLKSIGYPIVGDKLYGGINDLHRQALHAYCLIINSNILGYIKCVSNIPEDIIRIINN